MRVGKGISFSRDRLLQRRDTFLFDIGKPMHEDGDGHAWQAAQEIPVYLQHGPPFGPGVAVSDADLSGRPEEIRDNTVNVKKGELP